MASYGYDILLNWRSLISYTLLTFAAAFLGIRFIPGNRFVVVAVTLLVAFAALRFFIRSLWKSYVWHITDGDMVSLYCEEATPIHAANMRFHIGYCRACRSRWLKSVEDANCVNSRLRRIADEWQAASVRG
jgi:hypothetical protein